MNSLVGEFLSSAPYAATSKRTYARILDDLCAQEGIAEWGAEDLLLWISVHKWGNARQCVALAASQRFLRWRFGSAHAALSARLKRVGSKRQRVLDTDQALKLLASFDTSKPKGARDLAIAALALDTGLRCSEICRLKTCDVDLSLRTLQVIVKGDRWGWAVFSPETAQYIREWLAHRAGRGQVEYLFCSTKEWTGLKPGGLQKIVEGWGLRIGLKLSPHDMRRSFATLATIFGAPSRVVQQAGRWSDTQMVERYTRGLQLGAISPYFPVANLGIGARTIGSHAKK